MAPLKTTFAGLELKSPIIISSSGLTDSPEKIKRLEEAGAAAVVKPAQRESELCGVAFSGVERGALPQLFAFRRVLVYGVRVEALFGRSPEVLHAYEYITLIVECQVLVVRRPHLVGFVRNAVSAAFHYLVALFVEYLQPHVERAVGLDDEEGVSDAVVVCHNLVFVIVQSDRRHLRVLAVIRSPLGAGGRR